MISATNYHFDKVMKECLPLTDSEQNEIARQYASTKNVTLRNKLVNHNLRLVMKVCNRYAVTLKGNSDVQAEGIIGLMMGIDRFDPSKGANFSNYVYHWIKAYVLAYTFLNAKMVSNRQDKDLFIAMQRMRRQLSSCGEEVTSEMLSHALGKDESEINRLERLFHREVPVDTIGNRDEDDASSGEIELVSEGSNAEDCYDEMAMKRAFNTFRGSLTPQELTVFNERVVGERLLAEVGREINVCGERVRQLEKRVLDKFKRFAERHKLNGMLTAA